MSSIDISFLILRNTFSAAGPPSWVGRGGKFLDILSGWKKIISKSKRFGSHLWQEPAFVPMLKFPWKSELRLVGLAASRDALHPVGSGFVWLRPHCTPWSWFSQQFFPLFFWTSAGRESAKKIRLKSISNMHRALESGSSYFSSMPSRTFFEGFKAFLPQFSFHLSPQKEPWRSERFPFF